MSLGGSDDRGRDQRVDLTQRSHPRLGTDRGTAGSHGHLVDAGLAGELPGEGVLAGTAADDEDPGRHDREAHPVATVGRWRMGRYARSMVWVRSGPTDTSTIGTPAATSRAVT